MEPRLVGRAGELRRVIAAVRQPPAVVVIDGEEGIGKTRLVSELRVGGVDGVRILLGHCHRIREPFPLGPLIEAVRSVGDELRTTDLPQVTGALRPMLPEVAEVLPRAPDRLDDRRAERHRVFRAILDLLNALGPAVLVLEDLHWADEQTVEFIGYLFSEPPPQLSMLLTFRGEEVDPAVRAMMGRLPGGVTRVEVPLTPLDQTSTGDLAAMILAVEQVPNELVHRLQERTSGSPLALVELLALLRARGARFPDRERWDPSALDTLGVPTGIRDTVLGQVAPLSQFARSLIAAAAVLQEPVRPNELLSVVNLAPGHAVAGLEEALESGVLVENDRTVGFRHLLAAQAVEEDLTGPRRRDLHRRAAVTLQETSAPPLGRVAYHLRSADIRPEWAQIAEHAADQAVGAGDDTEAARLLEDVLRHGGLVGDQRERIAVKLARVGVETFAAGPRLIDLLESIPLDEFSAVTRGELRFQLGIMTYQSGGDPARQRALFASAVPDLNELPALQVWAMVVLGFPIATNVTLSEYRSWLTLALDRIPTLDDPSTEVLLTGKVAMGLTPMGDLRWRDLDEQILARTSGRASNRYEVSAYFSAGAAACYAGHHYLAGALLDVGLEGAIACGPRRLELPLRATGALLDYCLGKWSGLDVEVARLSEELADLPAVQAEIEVVAGCLALIRGELDQAAERLSLCVETITALGGADLLPIPAAALARLLVAQGRIDETKPVVESVLNTLESRGMWAPLMRVLPPFVDALCRDSGPDRAAKLVASCEMQAQGKDLPLADAALPAARGFVHLFEAEHSAAVGEFRLAAKQYATLCCPYETAQIREAAAAALLGSGASEVSTELRGALEIYRQLGASWDADRVAQIARRHGIPVPAQRRGGRRSYGGRLSPREHEVATMAAAGRSNKEIAASLYLSVNTVSRHVSAAMRKLDVRSRAQIIHRLDSNESSARDKD